jgi:hypothetical protein
MKQIPMFGHERKVPKSDVMRATRAYARQNLAIAELVLAEPDRFPHLIEWAKLLKERYDKE